MDTEQIQGKPVWCQSNVSARNSRNVLVHKIMYIDCTIFMAHNHQDAQEIITYFSKSAKTFALKIKLKKIDIMCQSPMGSHTIFSYVLGKWYHKLTFIVILNIK